MARLPGNRELIAKVISPTQYLNQPEAVISQVLTGKFADGLGKIQNVPDRADFDPMPWQSLAVWMLTQMNVGATSKAMWITNRLPKKFSDHRCAQAHEGFGADRATWSPVTSSTRSWAKSLMRPNPKNI
jgi:hypothetical protein